jgi:hypothetical protein
MVTFTKINELDNNDKNIVTERKYSSHNNEKKNIFAEN